MHFLVVCMIARHLWQVQTCLDAAKSTAEAVEGFVHPCGVPGWRQVVNLDFSDINTACPDSWQLMTDTATGVRACGRMTTTPLSCDLTTFSTNGEYSRVCGHISAFQTDAFQEHNNFRNIQFHQAYLSVLQCIKQLVRRSCDLKHCRTETKERPEEVRQGRVIAL